MRTIKTIDEYINTFPEETQDILGKIRAIIVTAAPESVEMISYQMPTFKLRGKNLVHFAAYKNHIGFYPTPTGTAKFSSEIAPYIHGKGSIQFPLTKPIPYGLIRKITKFRVNELNKN